MSVSVSLYRKMEGLDPLLRDVLLSMTEEISNTPTKEDFTELKAALQELAEAQNRTEKRVEELAEAQNRTEKRVEELAEAQNRTEKRVEELAEAQNRTEKRVEELAEAQKKTEKELYSLTKTIKGMQVELGGLSHSLGYQLEDSIYPVLPIVLKEDFGIDLRGDLIRHFVIYPDGRDDEVNIYGEGMVNGKNVYIIGESKAQIGKGDAKSFSLMVKRLESHFNTTVVPLMVCYSIHPIVEEHIRTVYPGIKVYKSFQIKSRAGKSRL